MDIKCPSCGFDNMEGADRCDKCLHSLMQRDIPQPKKDDAIQSALLSKPVSELLTGEDLRVCSPSDSVEKVLKIFQKDKKGCALVYDKKNLVGIVSNRDILLRAVGIHKDLSKVKIEQIMTRNPSFVKPQDPIAYAVNKMSMGGYRHVPVLRDNGTPISILLIKDVLRYLSRSKRSY
jgi:CBS domain-containing protein